MNWDFKRSVLAGAYWLVLCSQTEATTGRHTHFGEEITYVSDGEGELLINGQALRKLKAGDGFIVPNGAIHEARATGSAPLKLVAVFTVDKGKPLTTPAQ
jgi:quercetin dioxygenase-like cupin family protein